ncbi:MAG: hypothetical protein ACW99J_19030 [Candidatus Thorarchaeota archaeon]|jgi:hypothetical protein
MSEIQLVIDKVGRITLYEVTVHVRSLIVKMLFNAPPTLRHISSCISTIFADNTDVEKGILALLLSVGDNDSETVFEVGDEVKFEEDGTPIGFVGLETRTLFIT